jgi:hypothetical protein
MTRSRPARAALTALVAVAAVLLTAGAAAGHGGPGGVHPARPGCDPLDGLAAAPPPTNLAPSGAQYGTDPHEFPRAQPAAQQQKAVFLLTGAVVDVRGGGPCP